MKRLAASLSISALAIALAATAVNVRAEDTPIKIGALFALSGPFADYGQEMLNGMNLYLAQHGDTIAGRKIQFITKDDQASGDSAKRLAQELIVNDKVDLLAGFTITPEAMAVGPLGTQAKKPMVIMNAATSIITEKSPYFVRYSFTLGQVASVLAKWSYQNGIKNVYTLVSDYGPGINAEGAFKKFFTGAGGTISGSDRAPQKGPEFAPFMERVKAAKPDALFVFVPSGEQGVAVTKAYQEAGLAKVGIKLITTGDITDEDVIDQMGDGAIGLITAFHYSSAHPSETNKKFVKAWESAYGTKIRVDFMGEAAYDGMHGIYDAIAAQKGQVDPDKTVELLKNEKFEAPRGPLAIDPATRDAINTVYLRKVQRVNGRLENVEFASVPDVKDPDHK
ncbi:MAG TPA: ABC transporter substrate-binding protein [Magnetospirillaceae bacterium]|jgi:branched-chain amino acid transport system substrate-binding protein